jgi:hypothetical protein
MVNLVVGEILLPLRTMLLIGSFIQLPGGKILSYVAWQSTLETQTKSLTSLGGGILLVLDYQMRNLLYILPRLLHNWISCLLLGMEHWIFKTLCQKVGTLHRELEMLVLKLWMQNLHQCTTKEWGSDRLQKTGPSVASRMLAWKHHLAFAILFHFFQLVLNDDSPVSRMLKIWVAGVEQLELDLIIETLEKRIHLLLCSVNVVSGVPWQLNELVQELIHHQTHLVQVKESLLLQLEGAIGHVVSSETSLKLIPGDGLNIGVGVAVGLPPVCCGSK